MNSNGEKVQYLYNQMFPVNLSLYTGLVKISIIWLRDEPTDIRGCCIILDDLWRNNGILNVVLSSATLDNMDEILQILVIKI